MARTKGARNKQTQKVLSDLNAMKFDLLYELIKIYKKDRKVLNRYFRKIEKIAGEYENRGEDPPPIETILSEADVDFFKQMRGESLNILVKLMGFCYPKLKSYNVTGNNQDSIIFKINIQNSSGDPELLIAGSGNAGMVEHKNRPAIDVPNKRLPEPVYAEEE